MLRRKHNATVFLTTVRSFSHCGALGCSPAENCHREAVLVATPPTNSALLACGAVGGCEEGRGWGRAGKLRVGSGRAGQRGAMGEAGKGR